MNLRFRFPLALLLALGVVSSVSAASGPIRQVPGEAALPQKAAPAVAFRAPGTAPARMTFEELDLLRIAAVQKRNAVDTTRPQIGINRGAGEATASMPALTWTKVAGGRVARLEVASPDALGIRTGLKFDSIPAGLELRAAGSLAPRMVQFAPGSSIAWQYKAGRTYWTPTTDGDRQVIELFAPDRVDPKALGVQVVEVSHMLTNSIERFSLAKAIGDSDICERDVVCRVAALGANYVNTKNSVARMVFTVAGQGTYTCTGTLLADTVASSQIPYFWTANHCIGDAATASTLETYWGFEATSCGGGVAAANTLVGGGAALLYTQPDNPDTSAYEGSDATLLRLNNPPPAGAYFSGWNANVLANGAAVLAVHHPQGDLKKSSLGNKVSQNTFLHIVGWTDGTTEQGSSGSGLFTNTGAGGAYELRGGLYGGSASCANSGSTANTQNRDIYSRLDVVFADVDQYLAPTVTAPGPTRDYTGAWYVPSESGWGLTAFQYNNASQSLFVLFFIYDSAGVAKWYELGGGWSATDVRSGNVLQSNAGQPWGTTFNPALRSFTTVGNATLTFTSATQGTLNFTVNGVTRSVTVQKL